MNETFINKVHLLILLTITLVKKYSKNLDNCNDNKNIIQVIKKIDL